jgi:opacity protein-like surface antigen
MDQDKETSNSGSDGEDDEVETTTTTMYGPLVRYYIGETGVFAKLSYMMGGTKFEDNASNGSDSYENEVKKSSLGIGAGYAISLSDNVALNPIITYHMDTWKNEYEIMDTDYEDTWKASGLNLKIGVTITM